MKIRSDDPTLSLKARGLIMMLMPWQVHGTPQPLCFGRTTRRSQAARGGDHHRSRHDPQLYVVPHRGSLGTCSHENTRDGQGRPWQ